MSLISDPISGVLGVFFKRAAESRLWMRLELLLEFFIASQVSFLGACGACLLAHQPVPFSVGAGMAAAAVAILGTFLGSPHAKGLYISLPQDDMKREMATQTTNIERT